MKANSLAIYRGGQDRSAAKIPAEAKETGRLIKSVGISFRHYFGRL